MKDRFQIAADLRSIARLLTIKEDSPFRARAYERGALALEKLETDLGALVQARRLRELPGIGRALANVIEEIYLTDQCELFDRLRDELPPGALELGGLPGLSLKKIAALHDALRIDSIADLKAACEAGRVARIKGFGARTQAKLLAEIAKLEAPAERILLLHEALEQAERLCAFLRACPELVRVDVAGALRRRREIIRRIRLVAAASAPRAVIERLLDYPELVHAESFEDTRCRGLLACGLPVELQVVSPEEHPLVLHARTGSHRHLAGLEALERARRPHRAAPPPRDEEEIYHALGLKPIAPELREGEGEIEAAQSGALPRLIEEPDVRGMVHCHTIYSDGRDSIEAMALAAQERGMSYITITDHSPSAFYAGGVKIDRLQAQWEEIATVQEKVKIRILKGTESDIVADGSLDYPETLLEKFDIIIASIHSRHKMESAQMTARLRRALSLPWFKVWGHPLGRLLQSRPPFECDMEAILDLVAEARCAIEINGDPRRLDLEPRWIRAARERGIKFIVSTDAHSTAAMCYLSLGIAMARRGWLGPADVLNTLDAGAFARAVHP